MNKRQVVIGSLAGGLLALGGLAGFAVKALADGIPSPNPLYYSGTLTENGQLVNAARPMTLNLWQNPMPTTGEVALCVTSVASTPVINGRFRIALDGSCKTAINGNPNAYVEVVVNGTSLGGRSKVGAVPYAVEADHAVSATTAVNAASAAYAADAGHAGSADNVPLLTVWQSYTPVMETQAGVAVAAASSAGEYRRVGDSVEVIIHTTISSAPGTGATFYQWLLPTGLTIDTSKIPLVGSAGGVVGGGAIGQGLNNNIMLVTYIRSANTVAATANGGATYYVNDTVPIAIGNGATGYIDLYFTVPIVGWTVNK